MKMKTLLGKTLKAAAVTGVTLPLVVIAQNSAAQFGSAARGTERWTLLTGPNLLSPSTRPLNSPTIVSERVASGVPKFEGSIYFNVQENPVENDLLNAKEKLVNAKQRLDRLRAERAAALARQHESEAAQKMFGGAESLPSKLASPAVPAETIRFDARMPATSTELPKASQPAGSDLKRE